MQIADKTVVAIDYKLTDPNGDVLDKSEPGQPLYYLQGAGQIVPGLETSLNGKSVGEEVTVTLDPENAYGPRDPELIRSIPREMFDEPDALEPGLQFDMPLDFDDEAQEDADEDDFDDEDFMLFTIMEVKDDEIIADGNHELAGIRLTFEVKVCEIREASDEELEHGHAHGPDMEPH